MNRVFALALTTIVAISAMTGAVSQDAPQRPTYRTAANFVLVDVHPTAGGRFVPDLTRDDFEIQEDGVRQTVATFERIDASGDPVGPARESSTVRESLELAAAPGVRVFVLFLDTYHVDMTSAGRMRQPVVALLERVLGPNDVVALVAPEMAPRDLTFVRRGEGLASAVERWWTWGRREIRQGNVRDPEDQRFVACYPVAGPGRTVSETASALIERRREEKTLTSLGDLVEYLGTLRDDRKTVLVVSEGWRLFKADSALATGGGPPRPPGVFVGATGRPESGTDPRTGTGPRSDCDGERLRLADVDHTRVLKTLMEDANRANISFYTIDPRGLPVFDSEMVSESPRLPQDPKASILVNDQNALRSRVESLQTLAENTDGLAIVNSGDTAAGITRIRDDTRSYYLVGYYSTRAFADGRFHRISVNVRRPGVTVRARRGYRAPSAEEAAARVRVADGKPAAASPVAAALALLPEPGRVMPVWVRAGAAKSAAPGEMSIWVVVELDASQRRVAGWESGGTVSLSVVGPQGQTVATAEDVLKGSSRATLCRFSAPGSLPDANYRVRAIVQSEAGARVEGAADLRVPSEEPLLFRRGPFTGPREVPTAVVEFRRQERLRVELPWLTDMATVSAMLLDRNGRSLAIPVAVSQPQGPGTPIGAEVVFAPLAAGAYVIEVAWGASGRSILAFRVIP